MIKCIEFPSQTFVDKESMFAELVKNEAKLVDLKKAQIYKSCEKSQFSFLNLDKIAQDGLKGFEVKSGYVYPVISTTNYMDSHKDVHFNGCFGKTVKEQQGKVYYALDHELKWNSILSWPKDVKMFTASLDWGMVGKDYSGQTEALVFEIDKSKIRNKEVVEAIENKSADFENSIRMVYYKIMLGVNSENKDFAANKAYYDSKIELIANKDVVEKDGYFWGVEELGIHKEGSLVVAGGSNDATSIIYEAEHKVTSEIEPTTVTQPEVKRRRN
jgi:hypothetical protein